MELFSYTRAEEPAAACAACEVLEDRILLSVVNWVGGSGDWDTAGNWLDSVTLTHHGNQRIAGRSYRPLRVRRAYASSCSPRF